MRKKSKHASKHARKKERKKLYPTHPWEMSRESESRARGMDSGSARLINRGIGAGITNGMRIGTVLGILHGKMEETSGRGERGASGGNRGDGGDGDDGEGGRGREKDRRRQKERQRERGKIDPDGRAMGGEDGKVKCRRMD